MGGWDLIYQYSHYAYNAPTPVWVWLIMSPLGWLPYPLMWYVWTAISIVIVTACAKVFDVKFWWLVPLSGAAMFNLWIGQIEALVLLGVTLGWLVVKRKLHPALMGVAWLLMLLKPQVTALPALLFAYWLWKERGMNAIVWAAGVSVWIVALSLAMFPTYPSDIIHTMQAYIAPGTNASVFPLGLVALPLIAWPGLDRLTQLRVALAVNLLCSPYILLYHTMTLLAIVGSPALMLLSWLPIGPFIYLVSIIPIAYLTVVIFRQVTAERIVRVSAWQKSVN
jgi:hypothetical protein